MSVATGTASLGSPELSRALWRLVASPRIRKQYLCYMVYNRGHVPSQAGYEAVRPGGRPSEAEADSGMGRSTIAIAGAHAKHERWMAKAAGLK